MLVRRLSHERREGLGCGRCPAAQTCNLHGSGCPADECRVHCSCDRVLMSKRRRLRRAPRGWRVTIEQLSTADARSHLVAGDQRSIASRLQPSVGVRVAYLRPISPQERGRVMRRLDVQPARPAQIASGTEPPLGGSCRHHLQSPERLASAPRPSDEARERCESVVRVASGRSHKRV